jgi:DNA-binding CsgD family transcriptional regulator
MVTAGAGMAIPFVEEAIAYAKLAQGRLDEARADAVTAAETPGFVYVTGWTLAPLAEIERLRGDGDTAAERANAALAVAEQAGSSWVAARARHVSARLAAQHGEWDVAERLIKRALDARVEGGFRLDQPDSLEALAEFAAGRARDEDAVRLLAAAGRARRDLGFVRVLPEQEHWDALARGLREALGDQGFADAWAEGEALACEEAVAWVRRTRGPRQRPDSGWDSLTPTECKVAALVAEGLTNPQIGERMFISAGTVKTHLAHIFKKLDVHSRGELTAQAVRRDAAG